MSANTLECVIIPSLEDDCMTTKVLRKVVCAIIPFPKGSELYVLLIITGMYSWPTRCVIQQTYYAFGVYNPMFTQSYPSPSHFLCPFQKHAWSRPSDSTESQKATLRPYKRLKRMQGKRAGSFFPRYRFTRYRYTPRSAENGAIPSRTKMQMSARVNLLAFPKLLLACLLTLTTNVV
jgi:hypothetical protein